VFAYRPNVDVGNLLKPLEYIKQYSPFVFSYFISTWYINWRILHVP